MHGPVVTAHSQQVAQSVGAVQSSGGVPVDSEVAGSAVLASSALPSLAAVVVPVVLELLASLAEADVTSPPDIVVLALTVLLAKLVLLPESSEPQAASHRIQIVRRILGSYRSATAAAAARPRSHPEMSADAGVYPAQPTP